MTFEKFWPRHIVEQAIQRHFEEVKAQLVDEPLDEWESDEYLIAEGRAPVNRKKHRPSTGVNREVIE